MARCSASVLAAAAALATACSSDNGGGGGGPDAKSALCATSMECGVGSWCNPLTNVCEPRGTTFTFDNDIYPKLMTACAGCHVDNVPDPQSTGNISVFADGPD